jgi:DNA-binding transcriptional MerR regulator
MGSISPDTAETGCDLAGGYPIGMVSTLSGLPVDVIRAWERRYGLPRPSRTVGGHRLYSPHDVRLLRRAAQLRAQGLSAAAACRQTLSEDADPDRTGRQHPAAHAAAAGSAVLANRLYAAARAVESDRAAAVIEEGAALLHIENLWQDVLAPALSRLGGDWEHGAASAAPEHLLSGLVRGRLSALLAAMPRLPAAPQIVIGAGPGERHDLGALFLALLLARAGWRVTFLGAETPTEALLEACRALRPQLAVVAATMAEHAEDALTALRVLRDHLPDPPRLSFGGPGFARIALPRADAQTLIRLREDVVLAALQLTGLPNTTQ